MSAEISEAVENVLARVRSAVVSRTPNANRDPDLIVSVTSTRFAIVRCVDAATSADHTALATMMSSGQCVWAAIVYAEREGSEIAGWVDAFHVSELDVLVSHLLGLRRALAEPVGVGGPL